MRAVISWCKDTHACRCRGMRSGGVFYLSHGPTFNGGGLPGRVRGANEIEEICRQLQEADGMLLVGNAKGHAGLVLRRHCFGAGIGAFGGCLGVWVFELHACRWCGRVGGIGQRPPTRPRRVSQHSGGQNRAHNRSGSGCFRGGRPRGPCRVVQLSGTALLPPPGPLQTAARPRKAVPLSPAPSRLIVYPRRR